MLFNDSNFVLLRSATECELINVANILRIVPHNPSHEVHYVDTRTSCYGIAIFWVNGTKDGLTFENKETRDRVFDELYNTLKATIINI